jgi:lipopolysaccharide export system protein LptA
MRFSILATAAWLAISITPAHGLDSDRSEPATIEADEVEFDFRNGTRTYKGDVVVVQGTLRITGDKVVIQYTEGDDEQIETATSWGSPATFKQRPQGKDEDVYGEGNEIVLHEIENTLTLIDNAVMTQAGNTARGKTIVYDINADKMTVKGMERRQAQEGDTDVTETETGRARVTISPEEQQSPAAGGDTSGEKADGDETSGADQGAE